MLHELILTLYHLLPFLATLGITAAALIPICDRLAAEMHR